MFAHWSIYIEIEEDRCVVYARHIFKGVENETTVTRSISG